MSGLQITVTQAGRAALVNAANTGTLPVQITAIGVTEQAFTPAATHTALPGEIKRLPTFAGAVVADDTIHVTLRDDGPDTYTLRGFSLYLQDGTLFALYGQSGVILEKSSQAMLLLAVDVRFVEVPATSIAFGDAGFINPPATTEVQGVVELATAAETVTGSDAVRAVTPAGTKAALDARLGAGAPTSFSRTLLAAGLAADHRSLLGLGSAALRDDGHGGGLDADLLDGQHGSWYRDWDNLTNRPAAFPPIAHGHPWSDLSGVPATALRWPSWGEVSDKPAAFPPASHTHAAADITSGQFDPARIPQGGVTQHQGALSIGWGQITGVPGAFPPIAHGHTIADVSGLQSALDGKLSLSGGVVTGTLFLPGLMVARGDVGTQQVMISFAFEDGMPRMYHVMEGTGAYSLYLLAPGGLPAPNAYAKLVVNYDARAFVVASDNLYFDGAQVWDARTFNPTSKADVGHAHDAADITSGLLNPARIPQGGVTQHQGALSIGWGQITGVPGAFPPIAHGHTIAEVSGLQGLLDAKAGLWTHAGFHAIDIVTGDFNSPAARFYFNREVQAAGGFQVFSSRRTKCDIEALAPGLEVLRALRPVRYRYRSDICDDGRTRLGLIAEDVAPVLPEPVIQHDGQPPTLDYDQLVAPMIAWLQLLDARLATLESVHA
ncbi:tail fiber domain-containing protein [Caldimonas sp.]|uniref:tail fiber domain-containing protein n=1 Tax=Caldimonas sp. TaxID=2838790 RepID=UPI00391C54B8